MSRNQRFALLGIAAVIAVVAVVIAVASGGDDKKKSDTTSAANPAGTTTSTGTGADTSTTPPPSATPINPPQTPDQPEAKSIVVEGGKPTGGTQKLKFKTGDKVEIDVVSDEADEAHLHGYDIEKKLTPGDTVRFRFTADMEGVFELELHESGAQLAKITVAP
jgi:hypothetical protein